MPKTKRNHISSRSIVCVICRYKIFKNGRVLKNSGKITNVIKERYTLLSNYDAENVTFPTGLCSSCSRSLYNCDTNKEAKLPFLKACSYINSERPSIHTRECANAAACDICLTARQMYKPSSHDPCDCDTCRQYNNFPETKTQISNIKSNITHKFTTKNLVDIQTQQNLSNNQIIKVASSLQAICGRGSVEPHFKEKLREIPQKIEQFYSHLTHRFLISNKDSYGDRVMVFCHDVEALVAYILEQRQYDPYNHIVRIGLDGGGGMFKIIMNIIDTTDCRHSRTGIFKDTGVKRTIILAVVEGIKENYENLNFILSKLFNLDRVKFYICTDIKLLNIITGIQSSACKQPCPYCSTGNLQNLNEIAEERTLGSIRCSASAYETAGSVKKYAKLYSSCINPPLLMGEDRQRIIDICAPPELHLMQGIVKYIYDKMAKVFPQGASLWLNKIHIKQQNYHNGTFVGNDCLKMLKNIDTLQQIAESCNMFVIQKYIHILRCLYDIVKSCFGMNLNPQYQYYIKNFENVYKDLGISITPKVHILIRHVPEFIKKHNRSLGWYSEQALESTHYEFLRNCWEKLGYKRTLGHPDYAQKLMRAVIVYSSKKI